MDQVKKKLLKCREKKICFTGFEEARPALLLGILVRDKRKRPYIDPVPTVSPVIKKQKTELSGVQAPNRSYTPPPVKDSRLKLPLPPPLATEPDQDGGTYFQFVFFFLVV